MSEVLKTPEASPKSSNKETITHFEERLKRARLRLARAKKELHVQSMRERSRRERDVGKIVLRLIDDDKLDGPVVALIRDESAWSAAVPRRSPRFAALPWASDSSRAGRSLAPAGSPRFQEVTFRPNVLRD